MKRDRNADLEKAEVVNAPRRAFLHLRALNATQIGTDKWELEIPCRELSVEANTLLSELFPHCENEIGKMLDRETLIAALIV